MITKGGDLMLFVGGKSIAYATNHTLSISADTKETSTKDSGGLWQTSEVGMLSWSCSSENLIGDPMAGIGYDELFQMMVARKPITGIFALEGNSTDFQEGKLGAAPANGWTAKASDGYTGQMVITSLEKNAPNGENATLKVDFQGVGELKKVAASRMAAPAVAKD